VCVANCRVSHAATPPSPCAHTHTHTHQIDVIRTAAAPYTASALKVGRRISAAAGDAFDRMSTAGPKSRTKSHFGAKARLE
jgi:hypothetical protein